MLYRCQSHISACPFMQLERDGRAPPHTSFLSCDKEANSCLCPETSSEGFLSPKIASLLETADSKSKHRKLLELSYVCF